MNEQKPKTIDEYKEWLKEEHNVEISDRTQTRYDVVTRKIELDFENCEFWKKLNIKITEFEDEYLLQNGYPLFMPRFEPKLDIKKFSSFILKTFRKNIIDNKNWPNEPDGGWILPNNWYTLINDIIRTLFVVKYLDGVEFLIGKIKGLCESFSIRCEVHLEAREEGYYAAHLYTTQNVEIPREKWDTEKIDIRFEIQITTQLQETIRKLIHRYYDQRRKRIKKEDIKWQWNYGDPEFIANYLGHILHYVEGMIMEIREKQKEEMG